MHEVVGLKDKLSLILSTVKALTLVDEDITRTAFMPDQLTDSVETR